MHTFNLDLQHNWGCHITYQSDDDFVETKALKIIFILVFDLKGGVR